MYVRGASVFTVLLFLLYSVIELLPMENSAVLSYKAILQLLAFSFMLASVNFLLKIEAISPIIRVALHFVVTTAIFYICFIWWSGFHNNFGVTLAVCAVYLLLYAAAIAIGFLFGKIKTKLTKERSNEYKSQFSDK